MKQIKQLDENVALLASVAISFIAGGEALDVDPAVLEQLQGIAGSCESTLIKLVDASDEDFVGAIISAIEQVQFAVEEYQALEREEY